MRNQILCGMAAVGLSFSSAFGATPGGDGVIRDLRCDESMVTARSAHKNYIR